MTTPRSGAVHLGPCAPSRRTVAPDRTESALRVPKWPRKTRLTPVQTQCYPSVCADRMLLSLLPNALIDHKFNANLTSDAHSPRRTHSAHKLQRDRPEVQRNTQETQVNRVTCESFTHPSRNTESPRHDGAIFLPSPTHDEEQKPQTTTVHALPLPFKEKRRC